MRFKRSNSDRLGIFHDVFNDGNCNNVSLCGSNGRVAAPAMLLAASSSFAKTILEESFSYTDEDVTVVIPDVGESQR